MAFPNTEADVDIILQTWALKAPNHKTRYNLTNEQLAQISDDSIVYTYTRLARQILEDEKAEFSAWKLNMFDGDPNGASEPFPTVTFPVMPATANPPKPGIEKRNQELYNYFKNHPNRTAESLADLSITDAPSQSISPDDLKPNGTVKAMPDDKVEITFNKQGQKACRWQMRRGEGDWSVVGDPTGSPFTDETASVGGNPEKREYRGIYLKDNKPFGQYSDILTVFTTP